MFGKPLLFLSSYAPLFALLAIRFQPRSLWISCAALAGLGVISLWFLLRLDGGSSPGPHVLTNIRDAGGEASSYLAGYLLPFLTVSTPTTRDVIAYVGFLAVAATIQLRSSAAQVNPLLYLLGYRVLSITDSKGLNAYIITRKPINTGETVLATRFRDDILVDRTQVAPNR
jgi:hypothetical protein